MSNVISIKSKKVLIPEGQLLVSGAKARAALGGMSRSQMYRHIEAGDLRPFSANTNPNPKRRGKLYFRVCDLEAFVEKFAKRQGV